MAVFEHTPPDDQMSAEQEAAFNEWRQLRDRMDEIRTPEAAHAAGKAYGRFFEAYTRNTYRPSTKVVPFPMPHRKRNATALGVASAENMEAGA
ncbi:hypothetical protein MesoLjLc_45440 [Mesorhizobium sp. L-8-10]|uniref:hypothetical protein n=1 Tax=Mesorhizobium sp. L-8-10 TaxID=2744523 RepID=UPI0019264623|nr:hypothetical protein [Mesorhizobium sp. L-8-10]BCH32614.1 hypothetical protein MesoLjLc_45440 [Mesorhizobium sp. L-8-10]